MVVQSVRDYYNTISANQCVNEWVSAASFLHLFQVTVIPVFTQLEYTSSAILADVISLLRVIISIIHVREYQLSTLT
jgi:hypothetical protein